MEATNETGNDPAGAQSRAAEGGANLSVGLGIEPDLNGLVKDGYKSTWGDIKKQCEREADSAWQSGKYSLADNPFIKGTWAHKWWHDEFSNCDA